MVQAANLPRHLEHAQLQRLGVGGEPTAAAFVGVWRALSAGIWPLRKSSFTDSILDVAAAELPQQASRVKDLNPVPVDDEADVGCTWSDRDLGIERW